VSAHWYGGGGEVVEYEVDLFLARLRYSFESGLHWPCLDCIAAAVHGQGEHRTWTGLLAQLQDLCRR
jgi:hypothetical protein